MRADHVLAVEGLFCPIPIARATERMVTVAAGEVLEIRATDPGVIIDVPAWCHSAGHEFLGYFRGGPRITCWVRKCVK
ncbi:MAG: sulfurtransferase TusA family protein [Candidatus Eisenbacteria bacterium]|nr:sulfurtransferase TusA family protein [Candidatus Eisenbacteria bacterium]